MSFSIDKVFEWAWANGLDVSLSSHEYYRPVLSDSTFATRSPLDYDSTAVLETQPVLTFSKRSKSQSITAHSWEYLAASFQYRSREIAQNLLVTPFEDFL